MNKLGFDCVEQLTRLKESLIKLIYSLPLWIVISRPGENFPVEIKSVNDIRPSPDGESVEIFSADTLILTVHSSEEWWVKAGKDESGKAVFLTEP